MHPTKSTKKANMIGGGHPMDEGETCLVRRVCCSSTITSMMHSSKGLIVHPFEAGRNMLCAAGHWFENSSWSLTLPIQGDIRSPGMGGQQGFVPAWWEGLCTAWHGYSASVPPWKLQWPWLFVCIKWRSRKRCHCYCRKWDVYFEEICDLFKEIISSSRSRCVCGSKVEYLRCFSCKLNTYTTGRA